ncbi:hypothetical protein FRC09_004578 [Ceratobasidium sp. 395]|nr:hypothetical protein FRC09_004578 [Ceratobasidium sp. 395]
MPSYQLSNTHAHTSHLKSTPSYSLLSVLDSSPEPTATASGTVPGQALFDNRSPSPSAVAQPEDSTRRYSQRVRINTKKIGPHNEEIAAQKRKRKNRKPRRKISTSSFASSEQSTTTNYASEYDADDAGRDGHTVVGPAPSSEAGGGGPPVQDVQRQSHHTDLLPPPPTPSVRPIHAPAIEAPRVDHDSTGPTSGTKPDAPDRSLGRSGPKHDAQRSGPKRNAQRSGPERDAQRSGPERDAQYWDFSANHERLEANLQRLVEANPDELSQITPDNLKAIIQVLQKDCPQRRSPVQTNQVLAPRLQAEVQPVANASSIAVGGGHHLTQQRPKLPGSFNHPDTESDSNPDIQVLNNSPVQFTLAAANQPSTHQPQYLSSTRPSRSPPLRARGQHSNFKPISTSPRCYGSQASAVITFATPIILKFPAPVPAGPAMGIDRLSRPPPRKTPRTEPRSGDELTPSRPRGTASQELRRAHRAAHPAPRLPKPPKIPKNARLSAAAIQAMNLARARYWLRRECERRAKAGSSSTSLELTRYPSPPELLEDDEEERVALAADLRGRDPNRGRKPKPAARNIHGNERHNLGVSKPHLYAYSVVEGAWQTRALVSAWAPEIYAVPWAQEFPNLPFEAPSHESLQVMVNSQPTYRGRVKEALRPLQIEPTPSGFYKSDFVHQALAVSLFYGPTAPATSFRNYYKPMPKTAVAFVLANVQFCLEEYDTGRHQPRDLNVFDMLNKYVAHLRGLKVARRTAKKRFACLALEWYEYGLNYSGAMELDDPFTQPITLAEEIRPDSPSSDEAAEDNYLPEDYTPAEQPEQPEQSDDELTEPETNKNGRYTARAKGKARA